MFTVASFCLDNLYKPALNVRANLNAELPGRWIGRAAATDLTVMKWPPRSPDLTPLDF